MSWRLPPLNALRAFEAAGRHVSFTRAGEELHVTPGAVSRQIKLLEQILGMNLFDRSNRELRLTEGGKQYLTTLSEMFERLDKTTKRLLDTQREQQLHIYCSMTFTLRWLVPRLGSFHALYPKRDIAFAERDRFRGMRDMKQVGGATDISGIDMADLEIHVIDHGERPGARRIAAAEISVHVALAETGILQRPFGDFGVQLRHCLVGGLSCRVFEGPDDIGARKFRHRARVSSLPCLIVAERTASANPLGCLSVSATREAYPVRPRFIRA